MAHVHMESQKLPRAANGKISEEVGWVPAKSQSPPEQLLWFIWRKSNASTRDSRLNCKKKSNILRAFIRITLSLNKLLSVQTGNFSFEAKGSGHLARIPNA